MPSTNASTSARRISSRFFSIKRNCSSTGADCSRAVFFAKSAQQVLFSFYCAEKLAAVCDFTIGGGFHLPVSASDFGL